MCKTASENCLLPAEDNCIRLRGKTGDYLTLLSCAVDKHGKTVCVDLCRPSGKVLYCGVPVDLVNVFVEELGLELIDNS